MEDIVDQIDQAAEPENEEGAVLYDGAVKLYLASVKDALDEAIKKDKMPSCYKGGGFFVRPSALYFVFKKGRQTKALDPSDAYKPTVFVWLPFEAGEGDRILCTDESCARYKQAMSLKGWNTTPIAQRVIGLSENYYIMTKCIYCKGCKVSMNGYDPRVMKQLSIELVEEFPAFLTKWSGMDKELVEFIRTGISPGVNANMFATIIRTAHMQKYDHSKLKYYHAATAANADADAKNIDRPRFKAFSGFADKKGYNGHYPSRWYINAVYVDYIQCIGPILDQCMASLTGTILKWDHSFKVPKFLMKVNGEPVFKALFTIVNELEQIRYQFFVPTKSQSHLREGLEAIAKSLKDHGLAEPVIGYTDVPAVDMAIFTECFPSLKKNVVPVQLDEYGDLPRLSLPDGVTPLLISSDQIEQACYVIQDALRGDTTEIHIGFDMEWDFTAGSGGTGPHKTALIQIAYGKTVYLLQVYHIKKLPSALINILRSTQIIKIDWNITADLAKLAHDFPVFEPSKTGNKFRGVVELGQLAFEKNAVPTSNASLASIMAATLQQNLSKELRVSEWSLATLSDEQIAYAALDAHVALIIWDILKVMDSTGGPLTGITTVGQENGRESFEAVVTIAALWICSGPQKAASIFGLHLPKTLDETALAIEQPWKSQDSQIPIECNEKEHNPTNEDTGDDDNSDSDYDSSNQKGKYKQGKSQDSDLPTRIFADLSHEMDKVIHTISRRHSLRIRFQQAFWNTLLIPHEIDKKNIIAVLPKMNTTGEKMLAVNPDWLWVRCWHYAPSKDVLYRLLKELFECWRPVKCSKTGQPLFDKETWKKAKAVLHDVQLGWLSDPDDVPLYQEKGHDGYGLQKYHCICGTNSVEGSCHNPMHSMFSYLGTSVEFTDAATADWRHVHNTDAGFRHKFQTEYKGHYDPWLDIAIDELEEDLLWDSSPPVQIKTSDINPLAFAMTEEKFGSPTIPPVIRMHSGLQPYTGPLEKALFKHTPVEILAMVHLSGKRKDTYTYLAQAQNTRFAVMPLHTEEEMKLFHKAVSVGGEWCPTNKSAPKFDEMITWWSEKALGTQNRIFYKLREHLESAWAVWKSHQDTHSSLIPSVEQRHPNERRVHSLDYVSKVLPAAGAGWQPTALTLSIKGPLSESESRATLNEQTASFAEEFRMAVDSDKEIPALQSQDSSNTAHNQVSQNLGLQQTYPLQDTDMIVDSPMEEITPQQQHSYLSPTYQMLNLLPHNGFDTRVGSQHVTMVQVPKFIGSGINYTTLQANTSAVPSSSTPYPATPSPLADSFTLKQWTGSSRGPRKCRICGSIGCPGSQNQVKCPYYTLRCTGP
ncbi:hypothetical protein GYMLUDRAFT_237207 [Collybiopsis luxurians FD-317 M1]|nr:hypothetical protein GYMLUDRAFT_237207 [Collybiopsis luxurians FD-317 M1]